MTHQVDHKRMLGDCRYHHIDDTYHKGAFKVNRYFLLTNPKFEWDNYIDYSLVSCMSHMISRFERRQ